MLVLRLGSGEDEQKIETFMEEGEILPGDGSAFMLHYNFPPFSVGEGTLHCVAQVDVKLGMDILLVQAFPNMYCVQLQQAFPYTIRFVADILESDGSSSMATAYSG